jgi:hypothetical protein
MAMRTIQTALLAGIASTALVGFAGMAAAKSPEIHVLAVPLPNGAVAEIRYSGNVAPAVILSRGVEPIETFAPLLADSDPNAPFAALERVSAEMDRQMALMLRNAEFLAPRPIPDASQLSQAAWSKLPAGTESYSFVAVQSGGDACTRSVQITARGGGQAPRVLSQTSGNCQDSGTTTIPAARPGLSSPAGGPNVIRANYDVGHNGVLREASAAQQ